MPQPVPITYGPFPALWRLVLKGIFTAAVGALGACAGFQQQTLTCRRDSDICELASGSEPPRRFSARALSQVRIIERHHSRGGDDGTPVLVVQGGEIQMMEVPLDTARAFAAAVEAGINNAQAVEFGGEVHESRWMIPGGVLVAGLGLAMIGAALSDLGRYRLILAPDRQAVCVIRHIGGFLVSRSSISLAGVRDVGVTIANEIVPFRLRFGKDSSVATGRLFLLAGDDEKRWLTKRALRGHRVHLTAAIELRRLLHLAPRPGGAEVQLAMLDRDHPGTP